MSSRIGQQLGNYRLVSLLGHGGFAEVYLGEHVYLKSQAAIKVLYARLVDEDLQGFLSEARILVGLVNPHIVRLLDFGVQDDTPFLVMDYASAGTLRQRHPRGSVVPLTTVVHYVSQLADALQYAHNVKVIHRDIKPENMLVGRNSEILLTDFGIAVVAQSSRHSVEQQVAGTIAYMAPEQLQSHPRAASDQYALAVVVYEWLSGDRPFQGSFTEVAAKHALTPPPPLREKNPALSPPVEQVIRTALEKDPDRRFPNVRAFANALEQASRGAAFSAPALEDVRPTQLSHLTPFALATDEATQPTEIVTPPRRPSPPSREQGVYTPVYPSHTPTPPVGVPQSPQRKRRLGVFALGLIALLLISTFVSWFVLSRTESPATGPSSTATATTPAKPGATSSPGVTSVAYPNVAGNYSGSIHNTYANIYSTMTLSITQNQGSMSGQFTVAQPLLGSGPFTGSIGADGRLQILVHSADTSAPILFSGVRQADGSLSGTYCSVNQNTQCDTNAGGYGVWNVTHN